MVDLEERLRRHVDAQLNQAEPVSAEEARTRARGTPNSTGATRWLALVAVIVVVAGVVAAVNARDPGGRPDVGSVVDAGQTPSLTLDGHRDFHLEVLNGDRQPTDAELKARYTDSFLAAITPGAFRSTRQPLVQLAPWRVLDEVERRDETALAVQLEAADGTQVRLTMHRGDTGKLDASTILKAQPCESIPIDEASLDPDVQSQLDWVLALIGSRDDPSDAELRHRLAPAFLEVVPPERFRAGLPQLRALGPYSLRHYEGSPQLLGLSARLGVWTGEEARLNLSIEAGPQHRITAFGIFTQLPCQLEG